MKQIGYGEVHELLIHEFGKDFLDEEQDEYKQNIEIGKETSKDDNMQSNIDYEIDELPQIVAYDDLEDGDVDYNYLAVGEED